jgi:hypothetical protein
MKCMICGGQTLPGAKLCLPCRAALRRARDDTVSELLPLPGRREAFAFSQSPGAGRSPPLAPAATRLERPLRRRLTAAQLHAAAVVAFVAAAGVLTFVTVHSAPREHPQAAAPSADAAPAFPPRVSPSTMLGTAREESHPSEMPVADVPAATPSAVTPPVAAMPAPVERKPDRAVHAKAATRVATLVELEPAGVPSPAPVVIAAPAQLAVAMTPAPAERSATLAASLAACAGNNFFVRTACEQRTRAQFCEGKWGLTAQCPSGVANDHGQ